MLRCATNCKQWDTTTKSKTLEIFHVAELLTCQLAAHGLFVRSLGEQSGLHPAERAEVDSSGEAQVDCEQRHLLTIHFHHATPEQRDQLQSVVLKSIGIRTHCTISKEEHKTGRSVFLLCDRSCCAASFDGGPATLPFSTPTKTTDIIFQILHGSGIPLKAALHKDHENLSTPGAASCEPIPIISDLQGVSASHRTTKCPGLGGAASRIGLIRTNSARWILISSTVAMLSSPMCA